MGHGGGDERQGGDRIDSRVLAWLTSWWRKQKEKPRERDT